MKIAYLILAHDNPFHLRRLVKAITSPSSVCFIHIDLKSNIVDFLTIASESVVLIDERLAVYWGDFSMVEATLVLIRTALADPRHFDRLVLLSGTDYPLRSVSYIENFFRRYPADEFINLVQMPAKAERKPLERLTHRWPRPPAPLVVRLFRRIMRRFGISPISRYHTYKRYLGHLVPYAGDQWWALSRAACQHIQIFVDQEPKLIRFFQNTFCPDEMFFQIILGNSSFMSRIRRNVTYVDWFSEDRHPAWISEEHLDDLFRSDLSFKPSDWYGAGKLLFARKFSDAHTHLVNSVDRRIREREQLGDEQRKESA
jgi:hypothetical protein